MKSNTKKRLIAFMLCMVLVLSSTISAFADEPQNTDSQSQAEVVTEPTADEPQNTDSQSQAEVVTEPAADEATEDTTTEDVSTENTITEDVSDTPDIEIPSKKEWSVQVGNATVKVNGSADALPADAQLSVTEITSEDEVKEIEKAVEEKAIEEQFSIKNIFSYDIKFLVNGSEVQPTTPVQVSVDTPEIVSNENTAVLHVDDNNVAEDMNGAVDGEGKVVFDAPHFSKYVIVQKGKSKVNVTIEYYDDTQTPKAMIYASKKELSPGESISNYDIADNWNINWAEKSTTDGKFESISNLDEIQVVSDCIIRVYYTPQEKTLAGSTTFYDYTVKAGKQDGSWGFSDTYYSFNQLTNDKSPKVSENKKLIAGTNDSNVGQNYPEYQQYKISLPALNGFTESTDKTKIEVSAAGIYAIKAEETGFTYKTATAYVGFGEPYPALTNAEVTAKKSPTTVDKTVADDDHVVAIGDIVTYTIEAYVPFLDAANTENRTFTITDKIKGAEYYLAGPNAVNSVTMEGKDGQVGEIVVNEDGKGFTVNLNTLVADTDNPNAGKKITVTYTAKVTKTTVENKAGSHAAGVDYGADNVPVKLFTGELVLLKYGDGNVNNALANAEFVLYKDGEEVPLTFTKQENGKYKYAPDAEDATATLVTDENGMIDVEGLDVGSYHFEETKAPEGYSINTDGKTLTLTVNGDVATAKLYNEGQLNDTKLSALPSTGGIGTTIFTIAGCVIMIAAAGLFFASRKKSDNK